MSYKVTTSNNNIVVDVTADKLALTVNPVEYSVSLSRTGGQGSKGDTVTNAYLDVNNNLILEVTDSAGDVSTINAGSLTLDLSTLTDVNITTPQEGDILIYDSLTTHFVNHSLTTSRLKDVDNSAVTDGAMLVYNGNTEKYTATTTIQNNNINILGGTF